MPPPFRRRLLLASAAAPLLPRQAASCTRIAVLPLRMVEGYPLVPGSIAGQPVQFILDTGAQGMLVTPAIAEALRLPLRGLTRIFGTGGSQQARVVLLPGLRLGDSPIAAQLAPVAALPVDLVATPPVAGLVGGTLLARFDLELDVAGGTVTLSDPGTCPPPPGEALALEVSRAGEPFVAVHVNGQALLALIDTGSRATLLTEATAARLGLRAPVAASTAAGIDGGRMTVQPVRVALGIGAASATETPVGIAALQLERGDMLLGLDVLARRRLWIGYGRGELRLGPLPP